MNSKGLCRAILGKLKAIRMDLIEQYECDTLDHYDSIVDLEEVIDDLECYLKIKPDKSSIVDTLLNKEYFSS